MGLQEILDEIKTVSKDNELNLIKQAKAEALKIINEKSSGLNSYYQIKKSSLDVELRRMKAKYFAKVELDALREYQHSESVLIETLLEESNQSILKVIKNDRVKYTAFLSRMIEGSMKLVDTNEMGISLSRDDEGLIHDIKKLVKGDISLLPPSKIAAGVIGISGDYYIDNSIETIFNKLKGDFLKLIVDEMK